MYTCRRLFSRSVAEMVRHSNGSDVDKRRKARIKNFGGQKYNITCAMRYKKTVDAHTVKVNRYTPTQTFSASLHTSTNLSPSMHSSDRPWPHILANKNVPSAWTYFLSPSAVIGVGLGVAGGNIDGFPNTLRAVVFLTLPTESALGGTGLDPVLDAGGGGGAIAE